MNLMSPNGTDGMEGDPQQAPPPQQGGSSGGSGMTQQPLVQEGLPPGLAHPMGSSSGTSAAGVGVGVGGGKPATAMRQAGGGAVPYEKSDMAPMAQRQLSVRGDSNPKKVAGMIAHTSREAEPPSIQAVGSACVNQAIKSIAIARSYVISDGMDFVVEPTRVPDEVMKNLVKLKLSKIEYREKNPQIEFIELKSANTTGTSALAGAISKNVREGKRVRITAIGAGPVFRAIDSIIRARSYLEDDGVDIQFQPSFTTIPSAQGTINAIMLEILARQT